MMEVLKVVFYAFAFVGLWAEFSRIVAPKEAVEYIKRVRAFKKGDELLPEDMKTTAIEFIYSVWCLAGLFTRNQYVFMGLILLGSIPLRHKGNATYLRIDAIVSFIAIIFILLNAFTFGIPLNFFVGRIE